ncbi:MAG: hypothetical protein GY696_31050 [Gammaproteobacteria bacterium]|nr:hypothetical protein [Gammaproteobacteria bacterium]
MESHDGGPRQIQAEGHDAILVDDVQLDVRLGGVGGHYETRHDEVLLHDGG